MADPGDLGPFKEPKMGELNPKMVEYDEAPFLPSGISPIEAISAVVQHSARQQPLQSTASAMNAKVIYVSPTPIDIGDIPPGDYYAPLAAASTANVQVIRALVSVPEAGDVMCLFPDLNRVNGGQLSVLDKTILAMYRVVYGSKELNGVLPGSTVKILDNHIISVIDSAFSAPPPSPEGTRVNRNSFENALVSYPVSTGPPVISADAKAFVSEMKASPLGEFSTTFLTALAANAQHESNLCANNAGDRRDSVGGNGEYAINAVSCTNARGDYCSFGYWQLNVCSSSGAGQRFAEYYKIELTDKATLYKAIVDPAKQFEFMSVEMSKMFPELVYKEQMPGMSVGESARHMAQKIASEFERCSGCGCATCGGAWEMVARGNLAAEMIKNGTHYA